MLTGQNTAAETTLGPRPTDWTRRPRPTARATTVLSADGGKEKELRPRLECVVLDQARSPVRRSPLAGVKSEARERKRKGLEKKPVGSGVSCLPSPSITSLSLSFFFFFRLSPPLPVGGRLPHYKNSGGAVRSDHSIFSRRIRLGLRRPLYEMLRCERRAARPVQTGKL